MRPAVRVALAALTVALLVLAGEAVYRTNPIQHAPQPADAIAAERLDLATTVALELTSTATAAQGSTDEFVVVGEKFGLITARRTAGQTAYSVAGTSTLPAPPQGLAVRPGLAAVACAWGGTVFVQLDDLQNPKIVGSVASGSSARNVVLAGDHAYIADWGGGLQVVSVADVRNPQTVGTGPTNGHAYDVAIKEDRAYVAAFDSGVVVFDISDPSQPRVVGEWKSLPAPTGIAITGNTVYVADEQRGLYLVDIAEPDRPRIVANVRTIVGARDVVPVGDVAYVTDLTGGLSAFEVSGEEAPTPLGRTQIGSAPVGLSSIQSDLLIATDDALFGRLK